MSSFDFTALIAFLQALFNAFRKLIEAVTKKGEEPAEEPAEEE